jgi:hypothetical protein
MLTHNRPGYSELALSRLVETLPDDARVTVWDNGSTGEMISILKKFERHPRVERIVYNRTNEKLRVPTNWFWQSLGEAEYVSKVDDDGMMPDNWTQILEQAHRDIPQAGVLGTWRFPDEDFVPDLARKKIQQFGDHQLLRNCWVEGSGYLMKRQVIEKIGLIRDGESFTTYCVRAAAAGFINGWYFPFLYQEHMDDPRAPHTEMKTEADFRRLQPLSASTFKVGSIEDWTNKLRQIAKSLQTCSYDPNDYIGRKAWVKQKMCRLMRKPYSPKA